MFVQAPELFAYAINTKILYLSFCLHPYLVCVRRKAQASICAGLFKPSLLAYAMSNKILEPGSIRPFF